MIDEKFFQAVISLRNEYKKRYQKDNSPRGCADIHGDQSSLREMIDSFSGDAGERTILRKISTLILADAASAASPLSVAFLGPEGTFTSQAVVNFYGDGVTHLPQKTISDVFRAVETGNAACGVVPVENSTEGAVTFTLDELMETDLKIIAEQYMRISMCLLAGKENKGRVIRIYSHPQPVGQCKVWLRRNYPDAEIIVVDSTTRAAESAREDDASAAIAAEIAASLYGLEVLARGIEDSRQNATRFFAIGDRLQKPTGNDKTSIVCAIKDRPAALSRLLEPFSKAGINMTKIESRPDKKKMWEYNFFIDFIGHRDDESVRRTLDEIKDETIFLKILGSYPVGRSL